MDSERTLRGTPVVPGTGYGTVVRPAPAPAVPPAVEVAEEDRAAEAARFSAAAEAVAGRLLDRSALASGVSSEVLKATATLAADRGLSGAALQRVRGGTDAVHAAVGAVDQFAGLFRSMGGLMAERVTDLYDIRDRLVAELTGQPEPGIPAPSTPSVLVADDLAPADTAGLDPERVVALATRLGGPTSHTAIIARQLGIPCVVAVPGVDELAVGAHVLVDGAAGEVVPRARPRPGARRRRGRPRPARGRGPLVRAGAHRRRARGRGAG